MNAAVLKLGERVMLIDAKDRHYLITLREGAEFHTHAGIVQHNDVIGVLEGSLIRGSTERSFLALRPTLSDVVLKMPRGAQVIYPKTSDNSDAGRRGSGMRVLEAGVGSGALSMTLLRAARSSRDTRSARISPSRRRRTSTTCSVPTSPTTCRSVT